VGPAGGTGSNAPQTRRFKQEGSLTEKVVLAGGVPRSLPGMNPASTLRLTTIFTKRPAPGAVKTRLSPPLAPEQAAELALAMLDDTVRLCAAELGFETRLRVAPPSALAWFRARYEDVPATAQKGEGLGVRLAAHFAAHLTGSVGNVTCVVIGSDAPHLGVERIHAAHAALADGADVVLGPDEGGGYHLVGLRRPVPELFTEIPMSTGDMFERTATLARSLGLTLELVPRGYDIDTPDDLERLARELRDPDLFPTDAPVRPHATAAVLSRLVPEPEPR